MADPVTGITSAASIGGGLISSKGAKSAAKAQAGAAEAAAAVQREMFDKIQSNLQPYMQTGQFANAAMQNLMGLVPEGWDDSGPMGETREQIAQRLAAKFYNGDTAAYEKDINDEVARQAAAQEKLKNINPLTSPLLKPIVMDQATLMQTPGYQFNLQQGLKAVQNAAAKRGLGNSGAALKGATQFATGLADSTYQNQFNNAVTNQTNQFNRLLAQQQSGQNAAAGLGGFGQQTATNIGNNMIGAANAAGAANIAGMGALGAGIQGAGNSLMAGMYGNGGFGAMGAGLNSLFNGTGFGTGFDVYNSVNNPANSAFF